MDFLVNSPAAVAQSVETRLRLWLGEFFGDTSAGTPYPQTILGKHSQAEADASIQNQVTSTDNVIDIQKYESTLDPVTRKLSVKLTIDTAFGATQLDLQNLGNF